MDYREIPAAGPAAELVECAWRARTPVASEGRVLPDGCMDLIVLGGRIVVAGPDTAAHRTTTPAGSVTTGLRFRPGALPALLGVPAAELRDRRPALDDVLPAPRRAALAAAPAAPAAPATVGRLPAAIAHRSPAPPEGYVGAAERGPDDPAVPLGDLARLFGVLSALRAAADDDRVGLPAPLPRPALRALARGMPAGELADRLGVTTRTLHRRCLATLGYGPSVARRVLRFRTASRLLYDGVPPAEVAARAGYADQPHLSREVRALAGVPATALHPGSPGRGPDTQVQANRSSDCPSGSRTVA
ncbi:helix-turn-helix domain-containing protein [Pseudonocardia nematodicida]|uniref:Helix-turn-helix domain-containing protein n=1 Tax=Pseudonocardia nematodicida TaxID=1206997 RepID=A0ABV1KIL2_9PSEU